MGGVPPPFPPSLLPITGITLLECLVVLAIVALLVGLGAPGFVDLLSGHRAAVATNDLVHALALARGEALKRARRVYLAPTGARWRDGWIVFVDRNDNRAYDAAGPDEPIAQHEALPASTQVTNASGAIREPFTDTLPPPRTYVLFDGHGYPRHRNGALSPGSFLVTDRGAVRTVCLAASGRVRVVVDRAGC